MKWIEGKTNSERTAEALVQYANWLIKIHAKVVA